MNLSKQNASRIVTELSGILEQQINLMDGNGVIVASTDAERIGTLHAGAQRLIAENLDELPVWDDDEYTGARKGLNLPVCFDTEIVGVIGITGEYDEVVKYGRVIKKMTEILLRENAYNHQKKMDESIRARFLDDWIFGTTVPDQRLIARGARLGIDITVPKRVFLAEIADLSQYSDTMDGQKLLDSVDKMVRRFIEQEKGGVFAKTASRMICLLPDCETARMQTLAAEITKAVRAQYGAVLQIGIDTRCSLVFHAVQKAEKALLACAYRRENQVCAYDDIGLELFIDEITEASKQEFVHRMFRGFSEEERREWIHLLQAYFSANGSITTAAASLYIHKNTLQYKLRRLYELTGYDVRNLADAALFYLALQFAAEKCRKSG